MDRQASLESALARIFKRGVSIKTVVDVGASNGMWSRVVMKYLKSANFLLIEAQECHLQALRSFCSQHRNCDYVLAAAGDSDGEVYFDNRVPFGGLASKDRTPTASVKLPMVSVDSEVHRRGLLGPYLIKLDTHGFEVPILDGAASVLKSANLVVIETYNFRVADGKALLFYEMCGLMSKLGFRPIDMCDPLWRAQDGIFWQFDLFFAPSKLTESKGAVLLNGARWDGQRMIGPCQKKE